ncbi:MAG TPA: poly-gamma-glutamate synthase PgsB, partial [Polyangiaceae bacterium]|nr:poly-gamma-glutamate synthase PgsB [Polyangiaceae bacterium]
MAGIEVLVGLTSALAALGAAELAVHRRRLRSIPIRVHVNGTRGKSSVTRLIAAGLREGGIRTCAKTTGTLARMILPDGTELPIYRPTGPNIIEQRRIVALAAAHDADALVIECMALQPQLQSLCELELIQSTHGVVTNARPDHLEVMGPKPRDVARALAGTTPVRGKLFLAAEEHRDVFEHAARDRRSEIVVTEPCDEASALVGFSYTEHPSNVGVALAVCEELGVARDTALEGMWKAKPDPGAMTERQVEFFGRPITFINGFAANDPVSTRQ